MDYFSRISRYFLDVLFTCRFPTINNFVKGIFATIAIIERFGRKKTMALQFLLYAGCVLLLTSTNEYVEPIRSLNF